MRAGPTCVFAVAMLTACNKDELTEKQFVEKLQGVYCEEWDACHTGDEACPTVFPDQTLDETEGCDFDGKTAQECLDGKWSCSIHYPEEEYYPQAPEVCHHVWSGGGGWPFGGGDCWPGLPDPESP